MAQFENAIQIVLKNEGGYIDDPADPGGETKYGISKARYPDLDIMNLTLQDAKDIYKRDFWNKNNLSKIKSQSIANFALDTVVHHGYGPQLIQKAVVASGVPIKIDGVIGSKTIAGINAIKNSGLFLMKAVDIRKAYMKDLVKKDPSLKKFENGWLARAGFFLPQGSVGNLVPMALVSYFAWKLFSKKA